MRKILFRAKRMDDEAWMYGWYEKYSFGRWPLKCAIIPCDDAEDGYYHHVMVISETVGQFTGLTDKNGKKIFEGDIVHVLGNQEVEDWKHVNYIGSVAFLDAGFCVIDGTIEDHALRRYQLPRLDFDLEVIGNIHDNPELLEDE